MRDTEVRLTRIYAAPTGSKAPSNTPNSEDHPAGSFDLVICGEEGDQIQANETHYKLSYWVVDLQTMAPIPHAGYSFNIAPNVNNQVSNNADWIARAPANEDYYMDRTFNVAVPADASLSGHILQAYAVLSAIQGDIVSFVQSEPFVIV